MVHDPCHARKKEGVIKSVGPEISERARPGRSNVRTGVVSEFERGCPLGKLLRPRRTLSSRGNPKKEDRLIWYCV